MALVEYLRLLPDERFLAIYAGLEKAGYGPLDKQVADALKFRPQAIKRLPMAKRAQRARQILLARGGNEELCYELFGTYLMTKHKGLVTGFLERTGVAHEDGMIDDVAKVAPDPAKLGEAVAALDGAHAPEDVTLYLGLCVAMWPEHAALAELWKGRSGVAVA